MSEADRLEIGSYAMGTITHIDWGANEVNVGLKDHSGEAEVTFPADHPATADLAGNHEGRALDAVHLPIGSPSLLLRVRDPGQP